MSFAYGVDLGLVTQLESLGITWADDHGARIDPFQAAKDKGANAVRLRVFVNPPKEAVWTKQDGTTCYLGFCDTESVAKTAQRVRDVGLRLMIDFHYSDHYADPQYQDTPDVWKKDTAEQLEVHVHEHTKSVLSALKECDVSPEWVQVGNEINMGMLFPLGSFKEYPDNLACFMNAGYDAVKEVFPECKVITHLTVVQKPQYVEPFLDAFFGCGGKTDVLGFSHYPYWFNLIGESRGDPPVERTAEYLLKYLVRYHEKYHKPVMICEVGEHEAEEDLSYRLVDQTVKAVKSVPNGQGLGVFYWEPAVNSAVIPDGYPLGAARVFAPNQLQFTKALNAYRDNQF